jgi:hypothetical protein
LISWGIWLAATGSRERDAIDEERTKLDARIEKLERKRRQPAAPPAAEVGFPGQSGAVLARF